MNITEHELAKFRGLRYQYKNCKDVPTKLILGRQLDDALGLAISCLEQPHPNDESLRNALVMLFMSMVDGDDAFIPKDKQLYRDAMRHLKTVIEHYHAGDSL